MPRQPAKRSRKKQAERSQGARINQAPRTSHLAVSAPVFSRAQWLAEILRDRIISGEYRAGERLQEANLQREFAFSNGPVREALQLIVADGLAERLPWQGVHVIDLDKTEITELFQVRLALFEYAAELAARRREPAAMATAEQIKQSFEEWLVKAGAARRDPAFHGGLSRWVLEAAGNSKLKAVWDRTMLQTLIYVNASIRRRAGVVKAAPIHRFIDAIVAGDVTEARHLARKLTQQTLEELGIVDAV